MMHSFVFHAVRCSSLQCVAVCCSVLQCVAVYCNVLQYPTTCCKEPYVDRGHFLLLFSCSRIFKPKHAQNKNPQGWEVLYDRFSTHLCLSHPPSTSTPQHAATRCSMLQHAATHCNTLNTLQHKRACIVPLQHHTATHCNTLQHTARYYNSALQHSCACHAPLQQHTTTHCNTLQHTATLPVIPPYTSIAIRIFLKRQQLLTSDATAHICCSELQ